MLRWLLLPALACLFATAGLKSQEKAPDPKKVEFFEKTIRPLLLSACVECHGPDKQRGGLRLDSRAALLQGGDSGPAIVPGQPEKSLLLRAVHYQDENLRMPPRRQLSRREVEHLTAWVRDGAVWPQNKETPRPVGAGSRFTITEKDRNFWSFRPVSSPTPPSVKTAGWVRNPVDAFILAALEAKGLKPSVQADRRTLLRRVTFDLTGLPPTPEEIETFLADSSPNAWEKVIDRLLASPHYGERWGRHWLDVARYGEDQAHTFQARLYPQGFRYRDWVTQAFNRDLPYDQFIRQQLAADLIDGPDQKQRLAALGFFALGPVYYGDPRKLDQIDDRLDTLSRGFLGLTLACARCHDHKYDPISTRDYYALAGIINSTDYVEVPLVAQPPVDPNQDKKKKAPPKYPHIHALKEGPRPANMRVLIRGNPDTPGEEVPRRFLAILGGDDARPFTKGSGRLELAEAIASKDNPLTARVLVNRVWKHHFGKGLVRTTSNFGALGERPSHPELLDYLASQFVQSGWSIKSLHRLLLTSAAYRQACVFDDRAEEVDPENRLLWRMNRRRLEVEAWRDAMLAASGNLDRSLGGPSLDLASPDNRRRTLYGMVSRHNLNPLLRLFDFPDPNITCDERTTTTVPLQQLFVLNSEFMARNARALVARLKSEKDDASRVQRAFLLLYGRPATAEEQKLALEYLSGKEPSGALLTRWVSLAQALLSANEFLYVD